MQFLHFSFGVGKSISLSLFVSPSLLSLFVSLPFSLPLSLSHSLQQVPPYLRFLWEFSSEIFQTTTSVHCGPTTSSLLSLSYGEKGGNKGEFILTFDLSIYLSIYLFLSPSLSSSIPALILRSPPLCHETPPTVTSTPTLDTTSTSTSHPTSTTTNNNMSTNTTLQDTTASPPTSDMEGHKEEEEINLIPHTNSSSHPSNILTSPSISSSSTFSLSSYLSSISKRTKNYFADVTLQSITQSQYFVIFLMACYLFLYVGSETCYGGWIFTYAVRVYNFEVRVCSLTYCNFS